MLKAGREQYAFSGANKTFPKVAPPSMTNLVDRADFRALRQEQAQTRKAVDDLERFFQTQFAQEMARANRDEMQKISAVRR